MTEYPIHLEGDLDPSVSRGLWLVKWLLAIPHYVVLAMLWIAAGLLTLVAFFAILFTGRYPRPVFDFVTGVLRWTWRVGFYAYSALGTDRYPPFTLAEVPDYPARLSIDRPARLSRGLVLVKWLLVFPQALVVAVLVGGGPYLSYRVSDSAVSLEGGGLIGLLVIIAAVVLLFTGRYPRDLFDLVMGLNRWVYRVGGYALLLTDEYPPFRYDGGSGTRSVDGRNPANPDAAVPEQHAAPLTPYDGRPARRWTTGRVVSVIAGSLLVLLGIGLAPTGAAGLWLDQTARDSDGFVSTGLEHFATPGYAISTEPEALRFHGSPSFTDHLLGEVRITGIGSSGTALFIGIAPAGPATRYLAPIDHTVVRSLAARSSVLDRYDGQAPPTAPGQEPFWEKTVSGTGRRHLDWQPRTGDWTVVVMNADSSRPVQADLGIGATLPWLHTTAIALIAAGLLCLLAGALLIAVPAGRSGRADRRSPLPPPRS